MTPFTNNSLEFTLDELPELTPEPTTARTKAHQPNALKTQTSVKVRTEPRRPNMLQAALKHADRGLYIFPAHVPIFDSQGKCTGCTCEHNKRSESYHQWLIKHGRGHEYDPNYQCSQPGKCPAVSWAKKSTNDKAQINKWWGKQWRSVDVETGKPVYFYPNIAIDCGKSGLLVLDEDAYKEIYGDLGDLLTPDEQETVKQLSGSHKGLHLLYAMPAGKAYGNATGELPEGIDIRGVGGYIIAEPSLHKSNNRYEWLEGYGPDEIELQTVPEALQAILDEAHQNSTKGEKATFTATTEKPDLIRWRISKAIRELIHNPPPEGQRSEADYSVCLSLIYAGATADEIRAVFQHYSIGTEGKYATAGDQYLAHTIGKARTWVADHPRPDVRATIDLLRLSIKTHNLADHVGPGPGSKKLRLVADAVFDLMQEDGRFNITAGKKRLGKYAGVSPNTVVNALALVNGVLFDVTPTANGFDIQLVDECRLQKFDPSLSVIRNMNTGGQKTENDKPAYSVHKADEPFLTGTSRYMREHIQRLAQELEIDAAQAKADYTFAGLGEGVLLAKDTWDRIGDFTADEYAKEIGIKKSAAQFYLRRAEKMGLAESDREGANGPKVYSFVPEFWQRIDEIAPNLRTYGTASRREDKRLEAAQQWTNKGIAAAQAANNTEQAQRLEQRFAKLAKQRTTHLQRLHPDLSTIEIERLAYEVAAYKQAAGSEFISKRRQLQTGWATEEKDTVRIIRELAYVAMDEFAAQGLLKPTRRMIVCEIMKFGTFDESTVSAVVASPKHMARYRAHCA